jgi:type II secretory pathway component PulK
METLTDGVIQLAFTILTVLLVPLLTAILAKVLKRVGLSVEAEKQAKLEKLVQDAILATEEWARAQVKGKVLKILPEDKLVRAVEQILAKVPGISEQEAIDLVNQELPKLRGAAGDFLKAASQAAATAE